MTTEKLHSSITITTSLGTIDTSKNEVEDLELEGKPIRDNFGGEKVGEVVDTWEKDGEIIIEGKLDSDVDSETLIGETIE